MTPYRLMLSRVGLSQADAANLHQVRLDTVKSWSAGRSRVPPGVIAELRALYARQKHAASQALHMISERPEVEKIELSYAVDDAEARAMGWPCAAAQWAFLGMVLAACDRPVSLVSNAVVSLPTPIV